MNLKLIIPAALLAILSSFLAINRTLLLAPPSISGSHDVLHAAELINLTGAVGPESIAFDPAGEGPYTGVADGRILKWRGHERGWTDFAVTSSQRVDCVRPLALDMEHVCGRPLGLRFEKKTGDLYIADAYLGLLVVGPDGGLATSLVKEAEGLPLLFTNDMDIDEENDVIYFTDSSKRFYRRICLISFSLHRQFMASILSGDKTGRLLKYNKTSKEVTVLLRGLAFANGVALSKDRSFLLVAETNSGKILRFWLHGPNAGTSDEFARVPGYPDNIRRNPDGEFWVALHAKMGLLSKLIVSYSWVGRSLFKLPISFKGLHLLLSGWQSHATAIKVGGGGEVVRVLEDCHGKRLRFISEVVEKDGKLWMGSVLMPFVGFYELQ